jgi:hypothetical protein
VVLLSPLPKQDRWSSTILEDRLEDFGPCSGADYLSNFVHNDHDGLHRLILLKYILYSRNVEILVPQNVHDLIGLVT